MGVRMDIDLALHGQHGQVLTRSEDLGANWGWPFTVGTSLPFVIALGCRREKCRHWVGGVVLLSECCFVGAGRSAAGKGANDALCGDTISRLARATLGWRHTSPPGAVLKSASVKPA